MSSVRDSRADVWIIKRSTFVIYLRLRIFNSYLSNGGFNVPANAFGKGKELLRLLNKDYRGKKIAFRQSKSRELFEKSANCDVANAKFAILRRA